MSIATFVVGSLALLLLVVNAQNANQPLILNAYFQNPDLGQNLSFVSGLDSRGYPSYSGFINVNEKWNSNTFFWFFPAQNGDANAPILMWLQGGPGGSSMFGLFSELGPFSVDANLDLVYNPWTWNDKYALLFVDNPVGVGFSFTNNERGFSRNTHEEVATNLHTFLVGFFTIFYQYAQNDFYVTGESYGGKYVPSCAYKIWQMNQKGGAKINLKGIAVGDGVFDPMTQFSGFGDFLYHIGLADENQVEVIKDYENAMKLNIAAQNWTAAFHVFDQFLNGDFWTYGTYFQNITGNTNYFNFLDFNYSANPYDQYLIQPQVRQALHVGSVPYWSYNQTVELFLIEDWMKSVAYMLPTLMNNYKVMLYNGQVDIILGPALAERLYREIPWKHMDKYRKAERTIWGVNAAGFPSGYVRQVENFYQVIVRGAGHMVPLDQPQRAQAMIRAFIAGTAFPPTL